MGLIDRKEKIPPTRSKEELNTLKEEIEAVNRKLAELTEEELKMVSGGRDYNCYVGFEIVSNKDSTLLIDPVKD